MMLKRIYRPLKKYDLGYNYVVNNLDSYKYTFFIHELRLRNKSYNTVLVFNKEVYAKFLIKSLKVVPFMLSQKIYFKIPIWLEDAEKILFFDKNDKLAKDNSIIMELYDLAWAHEFLYTKPFMKIKKSKVAFAKLIYDANKSRLSNFKYPQPKDDLDTKIYTMSEVLDESDLKMGWAIYNFNLKANECFELSHEITHDPEEKTLIKLKNKLSELSKHISNLKDILEAREKIWPQWQLLQNNYFKKKIQKRRYVFAILQDIIPIPFFNTLSLLFTDTLKEIGDNVAGHKGLQNSIKKYIDILRFMEIYKNDLFNPKFPSTKIVGYTP